MNAPLDSAAVRFAREVNVDAIVGPTHNYAGLSFGNEASMRSAGASSHPRRAARQGLAKMRRLHELGLTQAVLPPPRRPDPDALRRLGLADVDPAEALRRLADQSTTLVAAVMSASSMWAANAATVSPSADTADGRVHFTPANLVSTTHRSFEHPQTTKLLRHVFADERYFVVHDALPSTAAFADEGAANHNRLATAHGDPGVEVFVHGSDVGEPTLGRYPRRQTRLASTTIARSHGLDPARTLHVRQAAEAIDAGAFHNDVVAVTNQNLLLAHAAAFADPAGLRRALEGSGVDVTWIEVTEQEVPLEDAVTSYLFNSQLVTMPGPGAGMLLVAPAEVAETASTAAYLDHLVEDGSAIARVEIVDLRESMRNGGGPACVRLRVVLTNDELAAVSGRVVVDDALLDELEVWVDRHYRDELTPADLVDPALVAEGDAALGELATLLDLPGLYDLGW